MEWAGEEDKEKVGRRKAVKQINLYSDLYEMYIRTLHVSG